MGIMRKSDETWKGDIHKIRGQIGTNIDMWPITLKIHVDSACTVLQNGQFAALRKKYSSLNLLQILMIFLQPKPPIL